MKFHIAKKPIHADAPEYVLVIDDSALVFNRGEEACSLTPDQINQSWPGGLALLYSPTHSFVVTENDKIIDDPGHLPYLQNVLHAEPGYIASIVPNEEGSECVVVLYSPVKFDGEFDISYGHAKTATVVEKYFPGYAAQRLAWRDAKSALVKRISPLDAIADAEKQIDLLSMLVISLAEKQPEDERPEWLPQFKAAVEQGSSLQFKGADKAIADVAERKAQIRALQGQYFKAKQANNTGGA